MAAGLAAGLTTAGSRGAAGARDSDFHRGRGRRLGPQLPARDDQLAADVDHVGVVEVVVVEQHAQVDLILPGDLGQRLALRDGVLAALHGQDAQLDARLDGVRIVDAVARQNGGHVDAERVGDAVERVARLDLVRARAGDDARGRLDAAARIADGGGDQLGLASLGHGAATRPGWAWRRDTTRGVPGCTTSGFSPRLLAAMMSAIGTPYASATRRIDSPGRSVYSTPSVGRMISSWPICSMSGSFRLLAARMVTGLTL